VEKKGIPGKHDDVNETVPETATRTTRPGRAAAADQNFAKESVDEKRPEPPKRPADSTGMSHLGEGS